MKKAVEKLIEKAREDGWIVTVDEDFVNFYSKSPAGLELYFYFGLEDFEDENELTEAKQFIEAIYSWAKGCDLSYETYLRLDRFGHGQNGAPYDMRDVYNDMEACRDKIYSLGKNLHRHYHNEICKKK